MTPLVLLLVYMNFQLGNSSEEEVLYGIGIKLCNLKCSQRGSCMSFAYNSDRLACHLSHKDASQRTMQGLSVFPKKRDQALAGACFDLTVNCKEDTRCVERRRGGAVCVEGGRAFSSCNGRRCSSDSDCQAGQNFQCIDQTCKCVFGYSFNPANNSCVRRCKAYGVGFTTHRGPCLYNMQKRVTSTNAAACLDSCVSVERFTCISASYISPTRDCYLSKFKYFDVSRCYDVTNVRTFQRETVHKTMVIKNTRNNGKNEE